MIAGHYRLEEHIGSGAMGVVWRALDERLERSVAIKQILTQPGLSEAERQNVRQRAMREAKNAARFQHPNAVVVFDIAEHAGDPCLVMEYLPSKSLSAIIAERGTLPLGEVAAIGQQVAAALVAAHRAGIVHRDVKPGNILVAENGVAKITDFGISRAAGDLTLTQTGLIGGTPAYLAPELARGSDPAPSSDVFALGATLYHTIEGQPPYGNNANQLALLYAAANGKIIPPKSAGPATALLMSLLRSDPAERPSMSEARQQLAALAGDSPGPSPTLVSPPLTGGGHGGRQPAAVPAPLSNGAVRPPWQRADRPGADKPGAATAPPPTSTFDSVPPTSGNTSGGGGTGRRKPLVLGAIAAVVVLAATLLTIVLVNSGGGQDPGAQAQPSAPTSEQPSSSPPVPPLGQTKHTGGQLQWQTAGQRIEDFYDNPAGSWNLLTPAAQARFGSQEDFREYWAEHTVRGYRGIHAYKGNNADGSVDMQLNVDLGEGPQTVVLRVIESGGVLLIDGDPRPGGDSEG
ncbi:Serine/threonine protein kinase [Amycolatopsis arida]|uniref:non-specific serine/threonine protein kinase n=1 Tax=Amycolatopsis arida TaxID=587909 RepID=A0A1I5ZVI2_9PSEU|nr:serine/threonine-protein kinase [Amycolatopsis arida]TDX89397.1 serine/threonine protein kinase [Amycolatopsis arida]SFQ60471.1 Serine/threonine protein kinase [Amycolatopsis arida]